MRSQIFDLDEDQDDLLMFMQDNDDNDDNVIYLKALDENNNFQSFSFFDGSKLYKNQENEKDEVPNNTNQSEQIKINKNIKSFSEFCAFIQKSIDPHNVINITCHMLIMIEKAFLEEFGSNWKKLKHNDKRKKERILQKFYENSDIIIDCFRNEPDKYLRYVRKLIVEKYSKKRCKK